MNRKQILLLTLGLAAIATAAMISINSAHLKGESAAPNITLISATSAPALAEHIRSLKAPVVMVNFWASWCTPCKAELPSLLNLRKKLGPKGFQLVLVSIDEVSDLAEADEFLKQSGVDFPTFYKGRESAGFIESLYPDWQGSVPTSLLFGPELKRLDAWEGEATAEEFESRINQHLKGS